MLSVTYKPSILSVVMKNVIMLNALMQNVVMLIVVAPLQALMTNIRLE